MFAKPKGKPAKNDRTQVNRMNMRNRTSRPLTMPEFMRSDPDGELAALYMRVKTASAKPTKLPAKKNHFEMAKRTIPEEYSNVRSPVGNYIRRSFISPASERKIEDSFWKEIPPVPKIAQEKFQNASTADRVRSLEVCRKESGSALKDIMEEVEHEKEVEKEELEYNEQKREEIVKYKQDLEVKMDNRQLDNICRNRKNFLDSAFTSGIANIQMCNNTTEVFECYAETFHDVLELVAYGPKTADVSTQTITPRLQRTQMSLIYAGFWENCIWRQNRGVQTDDQNLTFENRSAAIYLQNSNISGRLFRLRNFFVWKYVLLFFLISAIFFIFLELKNLL